MWMVALLVIVAGIGLMRAPEPSLRRAAQGLVVLVVLFQALKQGLLL